MHDIYSDLLFRNHFTLKADAIAQAFDRLDCVAVSASWDNGGARSVKSTCRLCSSGVAIGDQTRTAVGM